METLDRSRPETWRNADNQFQAKFVNPSWEALPVSVQQKFYPDFLKKTSEDQVKLGQEAFQTKIAGDMVKQETEVNFKAESGDFKGAKAALEKMRVALSPEQYESKLSKINTAEQVGKLNSSIALQPDEWVAKLTDAYAKNEQIPDAPNISKNEIPKYLQFAKNVSAVQQDRNYADISADITASNIKSSVDLEKDPRFAKIRDEKYKQSLKESLADQFLGKPEGEAFSKDAMTMVKVFPQTDAPAQEAMEIRKFVNSNVPSIYRDAVSKALDSKINEMASNGGRLKPETELVQYGTQRLKVARDGGVFGTFHPDSEVKGNPGNAKANIEILKQMEDVELQLRNSGAKTRADVDRVIEEATAAGRAKKAAGEIGNQKGWFDFLKSRKKDEPVSPTGKITKYGYEQPGQKDYDSNSARGIGAADNKLVPGESVALSPDLEKSTGAKIGDKVVVTLANGEKMVKRFDDRTSKRLKGRVDIYSPDGKQPLDGVAVAKVERYTEDGQG